MWPRWFIGLRLTDKVFDASSFSQSRRRRFDGPDIAQRIFDHIVEQAIAKGLVGGDALYTDSIHLKANANKGRFDKEMVAKSRAAYWDDLDAAVTADRAVHGKSPLAPRDRQPPVKETKVSAGPIRTRATWCATASLKGSFTSISVQWTGEVRDHHRHACDGSQRA